jgi:lysine 2,3-aminomutase
MSSSRNAASARSSAASTRSGRVNASGPWAPFARREWRDALASGAWSDWRWQIQNRLTSVGAILEVLGEEFPVAPSTRAAMERVGASSEVSVTPNYLALADPNDPRDPILAQVLPDPAEAGLEGGPDAIAAASSIDPFASLDPFHEEELQIAKGVVNRYPDRALLLLTNFCSTLCRHCMRKREWPGLGGNDRFERLTDAEVDAAVAAIAARPAIRDVLLSGGDPLNLAPSYVGRALLLLRERCELDVLRIGSRVPVTLPQRIDDEWIAALAPAAPLFLNTHFNHAREVTRESAAAIAKLQRAGVVVSNQAVLLRGVNDTASDLLELSRALLRAGVRSYYLHHCDPVRGVRHFRVGLARALELVRSLNGRVTGLGIPKLTVDLPGGEGKVQADGPQLVRVERRGASDAARAGAATRDTFVYRSPLTGREVEVDGSEGAFEGAGSWRARESSRG